MTSVRLLVCLSVYALSNSDKYAWISTLPICVIEVNYNMLVIVDGMYISYSSFTGTFKRNRIHYKQWAIIVYYI